MTKQSKLVTHHDISADDLSDIQPIEDKPFKRPTLKDITIDLEEQVAAVIAEEDAKTDEEFEQEEQAALDEARAKQEASGSRRRNLNYLSFEEAREFVRGEMIQSRTGYEEWYERNKPKVVPRFPHRAYAREWVSWNDYLGTDNKFALGQQRKWRNYDEAILFVHTLKIKTFDEWKYWCKTFPDQRPEDIPKRPDLIYKNWRSWSHWLGNRTVEAVEAVKQAARTIQVYYIIKEEGAPGNVMQFGIEPRGLSAFKRRWENQHFEIVKMFWYDPEHAEQIHRIVEALSSPYQEYEAERIVPNVWEVIYQLQFLLRPVTPKEAQNTP